MLETKSVKQEVCVGYPVWWVDANTAGTGRGSFCRSFLFAEQRDIPNLTTDPLKSAIMDQNQMVCGVEHCHGHGECVTINGLPACNCMLGYKGETCMETVNGGLSIPLTLGILACIVGFVVLAFVLAFVQQRRRAKAWKHTGGGNGNLLLYNTKEEQK